MNVAVTVHILLSRWLDIEPHCATPHNHCGDMHRAHVLEDAMGSSLPDDRAAGLMVPSPFVVEYICVATDSARCSDVKSSATQERVFSTERVCVEDGRLKLHEHLLRPAAGG